MIGFLKKRMGNLPEELADEAAEMVEDTAEMIREASKVLTTQRWQLQKVPFSGFNSPPGRF